MCGWMWARWEGDKGKGVQGCLGEVGLGGCLEYGCSYEVGGFHIVEVLWS